ncbi:MAG: hypothetical protein ACI9CE_000915 [Flavobacterium sp.]|jgi:hypothetical protein
MFSNLFNDIPYAYRSVFVRGSDGGGYTVFYSEQSRRAYVININLWSDMDTEYLLLFKTRRGA